MTKTILATIAVTTLCLCGCSRISQEATELPEEPITPVQQQSGGAGEVTADANIPACSSEQFAISNYQVAGSDYVDLDMDGLEEFIIGYQYALTDDLGEPKEAAYFTVARWDGEQWQEWFSIPAPGDERYVDDGSIFSAGDINDDGVAELFLRFYGFGVSSRPETVYAWQVTNEGLEAAIPGESIEMSSDDHISLDYVSASHPGLEIIIAFAESGSEAHADAHPYRIEVYGWNGNTYEKISTQPAGRKYPGPEEALIAYVEAHHE